MPTHVHRESKTLAFTRGSLFALVIATSVACKSQGSTAKSGVGGEGAGGSGGAASGASGTAGAVGSTPMTLYHAGATEPYSVAVDAENVYWASSSLIQAPKSGGGTQVLLGTSAGGIFEIRAAPEYVYWIGGTSLVRAWKHGHEPSPPVLEELDFRGVSVLQRTSPAPESFTLPASPPEALLIDDTYAYVAIAGCAAVVRMHLTTLAQESLRFESPLEPTTGYTYLVRSGSDLYCGAWHRIFRIRDWGGLEPIVDTATRVAGIAVSAGRLYWLDKLSNMSGNPQGEMWSLPEGGSPSKLADVVTGTNGPAEIYVDEPRQRLVWVDSAVMEYSLTANAARVWKTTSFPSGGSDRDETFLYWTRASPSYGTVERVRLDEP